ncbi:MAG: hypothetical protein A2934_03405 [Candidatus Sungbacteria bacterium RIFCSPLOWO2_01_FULL_47_10]|uniref:DUF4430 domain-containing protein n=1 Tax=Candidatus Sungbacteria bacterium RIFCSPLOWO2_01_FULL_47_10 TaxID=1802276 RepID=A0A1G2L8V6_9BACT|nr:MAG: hypothetical protein A2934_03405 [Candidatus Sungbacteria bacterium RIFCSPLOWO2_01_FULL_47_10]
MFKTPHFFYWLITAIVFVGAVILIFFRNEEFIRESNMLTTELMQNAVKKPLPKTRLTVDYGNGKKRAFEGSAAPGFNLQDVFRGIESSVGVEFRVENGGNLFAVDGIPERAEKRWILSVNGKNPAEDPMFLSTEIHPGDKIVVHYE